MPKKWERSFGDKGGGKYKRGGEKIKEKRGSIGELGEGGLVG